MADDLVRQAEMVTLGAMLLDASVIDAVAARLRSSDFADIRHGSIFAAIIANHAAGAETGPLGIAFALNSVGELQRVGGASYLHTLIAAVPTTANTGWFVNVVDEAARVRTAEVEVIRFKQIVESGDLGKIDEERGRLVDLWTRQGRTTTDDAPSELDDFLAATEPEHDWLVRDLIERGDRIILTGAEGIGKSTLLRQVGVQTAAGIHPFTGESLDPLCVLIVDLENSRAQIRRQLRTLRLAASERYEPKPGLHVRVRAEGLDLLSSDDGRWLLDLVGSVQPDLLITGPTYKMAAGDPTEERTARSVTMWLDRVRTEVGTALLIEAHTPHGSNGGKRPIRPYGASLWLRWPEFGLYLSPEGHLQHWRGPRDQRDWPRALKRGGEWPWSPETNPSAIRWARVVELCNDEGRRLSEREIAKALGVGNGTAHRLITDNRVEWEWLGINLQVSGGGAE